MRSKRKSPLDILTTKFRAGVRTSSGAPFANRRQSTPWSAGGAGSALRHEDEQVCRRAGRDYVGAALAVAELHQQRLIIKPLEAAGKRCARRSVSNAARPKRTVFRSRSFSPSLQHPYHNAFFPSRHGRIEAPMRPPSACDLEIAGERARRASLQSRNVTALVPFTPSSCSVAQASIVFGLHPIRV